MSSPPKEEAGLNTSPKNNSLENISPKIESIFETDQKAEAPKLLKQEQKVPNRVTLPNQGRLKRHRSTQVSEASPQSKRAKGLGTPLTDAALQDPDKELALIIEEEFRLVKALRLEAEREHLVKLARAQALRESKQEDIKKHTEHPQETKIQEPTVEIKENVPEGNLTDDAVPPETDDILDLTSTIADIRNV
ncbi:uncharacterized protein FMAN_00288 [Fusarium mangiferae]|uniref:Uncharacterized protein n=1 Tax=Fusarium mangiferae TaxID=192010 RepID=A0A1L7U594_FUSMA|nr:uncharacterized protein FMAN_00288 [Fusarium mangiferae]CVL02847.1 uncharacterized protein FMAN_00288 [Fusarium mangiferae]